MASSCGDGRFYRLWRLPYKSPHGGPGIDARVGEEFGHVPHGKLRYVLAMDAVGDEQRIHAGQVGALDVGAQAIADGERAPSAFQLRTNRVVDRKVRLAVI